MEIQLACYKIIQQIEVIVFMDLYVILRLSETRYLQANERSK